ncbi:MAG: sugar-binding domain-containing protein [Candidatus Latescibacterota bacterium]
MTGKNGRNIVQQLVGLWTLAPDPENRGRKERWFEGGTQEGAQAAPVPGIIQQVFPEYHGVAWYGHTFWPLMPNSPGSRHLLKFGAVDYLAEVWVNGIPVGEHEGGETPFILDVTDALVADGENRLVVRVLNPIEEPIDGIVLKETPHRNKRNRDYAPGSSFNHGGIMLPVELHEVPEVRIADLFVRPDSATGHIRTTIAVQNDRGKPATAQLLLSVSPASSGGVLTTVRATMDCAPGETVHELTLPVGQPRLWSTEDPYLYRVGAVVQAHREDLVFTHEQAVRCGFRDFRVERGYFRLNGKRVFLRSTHTGNHFPIGQQIPHDPDLLRRDLIYAKASGFNMVRFIAGVAYPEQLDFCDEIGLMVYEESYAGWCLEDSPNMGERYDRSTFEMIQRDRNHPSLVIWGLLNETKDGPVFRHAHACLPRLREYDDTRLVLLNSGRWDCQPSIGSVSNPGSSEWEHVWGSEAPGMPPVSDSPEWEHVWGPEVPGMPPVSDAWSDEAGGYFEKAGDAHVYPIVPQTKRINTFIRTLGQDTQPVFLSEYGIGSLLDVIHGTRRYEQEGARPDLADAALFRAMAARLSADWSRLGMEGVYPFPEDMLRDSQRLHARQRLFGFDLIRSNPKLCGYNLTGILDHGMTGEGAWTFWREWKPGIVDALSDGWAPLRWCLFVDPIHGYADQEFTLEAVLANEEVLKPGHYPVCLRVSGPSGIAWERRTAARIPEPPPGEEGPLSIPVFCEKVGLPGKAGVYEFAASMERGGSPAGGRLKCYVSDRADLPQVEGPVTVWGMEERVEEWLTSHGMDCRPFGEPAPDRREVLLVGDLSNMPTDENDWRAVWARIAGGSTAVFFSPLAFRRGEDAVGWLPLANKGRCYWFNDWLYHKECVAKAHPIFDGLQGKGIMDWDYYGELIPHYFFDGQDTPDDVAAAAFATGYPCPGGYASGVLFGGYSMGEGRFFINTFPVLENLDAHPAADRLLLNIVRYAMGDRHKPSAEKPA